MSLADLVHFVHGQHPNLPEHHPDSRDTLIPTWRIPEVPGVDPPDWIRDSRPGGDWEEGDRRKLGEERPQVEEPLLRPENLQPDLLAYYLPFHFYGPRTWGIYVLESGVVRLAAGLGASAAWPEALEAALEVLLVHERFHAVAEAGATRMESLVAIELYRHRLLDPPARLREEAMANAQAARAIRHAYPQLSPALEAMMLKWPAGYRDFARWLGNADQAKGRGEMAESLRGYGGFPSLGGPGEFLFSNLSAGDKSFVPTYWVLDGHRRGLFLPDWFLRRHPGSGTLST